MDHDLGELPSSKHVTLYIDPSSPDRVTPYFLDTKAQYIPADTLRLPSIRIDSFPIFPNINSKCDHYNAICTNPSNKQRSNMRNWCETEPYNLIRLGKHNSRRCYYLPWLAIHIEKQLQTSSTGPIYHPPFPIVENDECVLKKDYQLEPVELQKIYLQLRDADVNPRDKLHKYITLKLNLPIHAFEIATHDRQYPV